VIKVVLASALARWLSGAGRGERGEIVVEVEADSLFAALNGVFALHPNLRGYVLDDAGVVRHHVAVFIDGQAIDDKRNLEVPLALGAEVYLMQALSGG
jgi:sulfur-carrier protein